VEAFNIYDKNGSKRLEKEELRIVLEGKLIIKKWVTTLRMRS